MSILLENQSFQTTAKCTMIAPWQSVHPRGERYKVDPTSLILVTRSTHSTARILWYNNRGMSYLTYELLLNDIMLLIKLNSLVYDTIATDFYSLNNDVCTSEMCLTTHSGIVVKSYMGVRNVVCLLLFFFLNNVFIYYFLYWKSSSMLSTEQKEKNSKMLKIKHQNLTFFQLMVVDGYTGAICSSMARTFAHGAMGRRIDPSWWTYRAISRSSHCSTTDVTKAVVCVILSVGGDAYKITLAANRKE